MISGSGRKVVIRLDAGAMIGSGHLMRCLAYCSSIQKMGFDVIYAVSDEESAKLVRTRGGKAEVLSGNKMCLSQRDGEKLADFARSCKAIAILVDSYAVRQQFFDSLRCEYRGNIGYIDDLYLFDTGFSANPYAWNVTHIINYGFGFEESDYVDAYSAASPRLLIGPSYAPIREEFIDAYSVSTDSVERILITSGSTNPVFSLERMTEGCRKAAPNAQIDVVVGAYSSFSDCFTRDEGISIHKNVINMCPLMSSADLAVSAAGATLYELACLGVPTIAVPIVENQMGNIRGLLKRNMGLAIEKLKWDVSDIVKAVELLVGDNQIREQLSRVSRKTVDGYGPHRVAASLLEGCMESSKYDAL